MPSFRQTQSNLSQSGDINMKECFQIELQHARRFVSFMVQKTQDPSQQNTASQSYCHSFVLLFPIFLHRLCLVHQLRAEDLFANINHFLLHLIDFFHYQKTHLIIIVKPEQKRITMRRCSRFYKISVQGKYCLFYVSIIECNIDAFGA